MSCHFRYRHTRNRPIIHCALWKTAEGRPQWGPGAPDIHFCYVRFYWLYRSVSKCFKQVGIALRSSVTSRSAIRKSSDGQFKLAIRGETWTDLLVPFTTWARWLMTSCKRKRWVWLALHPAHIVEQSKWCEKISVSRIAVISMMILTTPPGNWIAIFKRPPSVASQRLTTLDTNDTCSAKVSPSSISIPTLSLVKMVWDWSRIKKQTQTTAASYWIRSMLL